jgi:hypothetical protein
MRSKLGERDEDVNIPRVQQRGAAPKLSTRRRQRFGAYETGADSYQQIAPESGVHFNGRANYAPANEASERSSRETVADGPLVV